MRSILFGFLISLAILGPTPSALLHSCVAQQAASDSQSKLEQLKKTLLTVPERKDFEVWNNEWRKLLQLGFLDVDGPGLVALGVNNGTPFTITVEPAKPLFLNGRNTKIGAGPTFTVGPKQKIYLATEAKPGVVPIRHDFNTAVPVFSVTTRTLGKLRVRAAPTDLTTLDFEIAVVYSVDGEGAVRSTYWLVKPAEVDAFFEDLNKQLFPPAM